MPALLLGVHWAWTALSTVFVAGRLHGRTHEGIKLGWEDLWIVLALVWRTSFWPLTRIELY